MDWTTLILIEVSFVEFLIVIILFALLARKRSAKSSYEVPSQSSVKQIEKEAAAISSVGKNIYRKQPPRIKYDEPIKKGPSFIKLVLLFLLSAATSFVKGLKVLFVSIGKTIAFPFIKLAAGLRNIRERMHRARVLRKARKSREAARNQALKAKIVTVKPAVRAKSLPVEKVEEVKIARNIFKDNLLVLVLAVIIAIGYGIYRNISRINSWISYIWNSDFRTPVIIVVFLIILFIGDWLVISLRSRRKY
jgi:hypothetical protein